MKLLTNTDWGVPGPVSRHTAVGFVSMELVAGATAEDHQESSVAEKRLPVLQVSKTTASLSSTHCRQFHNECTAYLDNTQVWKLSTWSVDAEQSEQCSQSLSSHLNVRVQDDTTIYWDTSRKIWTGKDGRAGWRVKHLESESGEYMRGRRDVVWDYCRMGRWEEGRDEGGVRWWWKTLWQMDREVSGEMFFLPAL